LRLGAGIRLEADDQLARDLALDEALDITQQVTLINAHQRYSFAGSACAASTPDPVYIVLRDVRQIEVDNIG
jgi:hypothetical protein